MRMKAALVCLLLATGAAQAQTPVAAAMNLPDLVAKLLPQVVNISFQRNEPAPAVAGVPSYLAPAPVKRGVGTGFVIDPAGIIATNRHVTDGGDEIYVSMSDNTRLRATLIYRSPDIDFALLRVTPPQPLQPVKWGDSSAMRQGDRVIAIGNPLGLGGTVTSGILSAVDRDIRLTGLDAFLQIDASINPGNSGGPLFNERGEVIGVNTALFGAPNSTASGSIGLNFAIPGNDVQFILDNLRLYGRMRRGIIGALLQDMTAELADSLGLPQVKGVIVAKTVPGGPAEKGGLLAGDVIMQFAGGDTPNLRGAQRFITASPGRADVAIRVLRDGKMVDLRVTLGEAPDNGEKIDMTVAAPPKADFNADALGLAIVPLTDSLRRMFKVEPNVSGVVLIGVTKDGLGATLGLDIGSVLMRTQDGPITSLNDIVLAGTTAQAKGRNNIAVLAVDQIGPRWVALPLVAVK